MCSFFDFRPRALPLWPAAVALFVVAWIGQFIGHAVEGRRPKFFQDLTFLLIGPLWVVLK
ncbi:MAG: Mpo1-like protein [Steroidobacteraceae bacterium]